MEPELYIVYQDCPLCGDKGKEVKDKFTAEGIRLRKVSFVTELGRDLIYEAVSRHGIKTMPFFCDLDRKRFSLNAEDFLAKEEPKPVVKKTTKKKRGKK